MCGGEGEHRLLRPTLFIVQGFLNIEFWNLELAPKRSVYSWPRWRSGTMHPLAIFGAVLQSLVGTDGFPQMIWYSPVPLMQNEPGKILCGGRTPAHLRMYRASLPHVSALSCRSEVHTTDRASKHKTQRQTRRATGGFFFVHAVALVGASTHHRSIIDRSRINPSTQFRVQEVGSIIDSSESLQRALFSAMCVCVCLLNLKRPSSCVMARRPRKPRTAGKQVEMAD